MLKYHKKVHSYFKTQTKTWDYFASAKTKEEQLIELKNELLKNTYKFNEATDLKIYDKINTIKSVYNLSNVKVTVYQAQYNDDRNASVIYLQNEAHIVFSGGILQLMNEDELLAILAHELAHVKLYTEMNGEIEIADRIITAIANSASSEMNYYETARKFKLYTEIYCDKTALLVTKNIDPIITSLVKSSTGLQQINAETYLQQADEIFEKSGSSKSENNSHPENFIRAKAIQLWNIDELVAEEKIIQMIEGKYELDSLDIFNQETLKALSMHILELIMKPKWMQTTLHINLCKQYFSNFQIENKTLLTEKILNELQDLHISIKNYLAYMLFDFAKADVSLEKIPMGWTFQLSEDLLIKDNFENVVKKESKLSDKNLKLLKADSLNQYYQVKEGDKEQIYEQ